MLPPASGLAASTLDADFLKQQANEEKAMEEKDLEGLRQKQGYLGKIYGAVSNQEAHFKKNPIDPLFEGNAAKHQEQILIRGYLKYHNGMRPVPTDEMGYGLMRAAVANRRFGGRGANDDAVFFQELQKESQRWHTTREQRKDLRQAAFADAALPRGEGGGYTPWLEKARTAPGHDPAQEPRLMEEFHEERYQATKVIDEFRPQLTHLWRIFKVEGNVTLEAYEIWKQLPPERQGDFLTAIAIRAKAMPKEEQATWLGNVTKTWERAFYDYGRRVSEGVRSFSQVGAVNLSYGGSPSLSPQREAEIRAGREKEQMDFLRMRDFAGELLRISREDYDPLKSATESGGDPGFWEQALYDTPGVISTSLTMAVPVAGTLAMAAYMESSSYETVRDRFLAEGLDPDLARQYASTLAPLMMAPQLALEKVKFGLWSRKVPGVAKVLDSLDGLIVNGVLRRVVVTGSVSVAEAGVEHLQTATGYAVQELAHALEPAIPGARILGKGGMLDGMWAETPSLLVTMAPLAVVSGMGGIARESRQSAFRNTSTTEKQAFGLTADAIAEIEAAKSPAALETAIEKAMATRDPWSDTAKAAVDQLKTQAASLSSTSQQLAALGYPLPRITAHTDGTFTVTDSSGKELGKATDLSGAERLAGTHTSSVEMERADRIAEMGTMLRGAGILATGHGVEQQLKPGEDFTAEEAAAISPEAAERIAEQRALLEESNGGSRDMTIVVLGHHTREIRGNLHQDVSTLYHGAHLGTMLEELSHAKWRAARAQGLTNRQEEISLLRAFDTVLAKATRGKSLRFIPEGMMDTDVTDTRIEEAIGQIAQMEIFRTPKDGKNAFGLPRDLVSAHIAAVGKITGQGTAWKFRSFIEALRTRMGLTMERTFVMKKAEKSGEFDRTTVDAYLAKLVGIESSQVREGTEGSSTQDLQQMGPSSGGNTATRQDGSGPKDAATAPASGEVSPEARFIAKAWKALAAHEDLFIFGRSASSSADKIAQAVSLPDRPVTAEDEGRYVRFYSATGYITIRDANTPNPYIAAVNAASQGMKDGGGSQLYAAALDWIYLNNKQIKDDPDGLSKINRIRRTSNFLASALRWKTTEHLFPHEDQQIEGWNENPTNNLYLLAVTEMRHVHQKVTGSGEWTFDFEKNMFLNGNDQELTEADLKRAVENSGPGKSAVGISTLRRAIVTASILSQMSQKSVEEFIASDNRKLARPLRRISYSLGSLENHSNSDQGAPSD